MTDFSHSLSLQATPTAVASRQRDGRFRRRCALARQASSASRAYSPVGPRTFTGFTLVGPVHTSAVLLRRTGVPEFWTLTNRKELKMKKKYLVFMVALVGIVALNNCSPDNKSSGQPTYDASEGLKGAVEKIPIPENSKVTSAKIGIFYVRMARMLPGFRWVLKSGKSIDEVERFYESSLQKSQQSRF